MVEQSNGQSKAEQTPSEDYRRGRRGTFVIALVAVALLAGLTGNLLSKAFGQGDGWHHIAWHDGGMFGGTGRCRRRAQPRTAPESRGLDNVGEAMVGALASRLMDTG